MCQTLFYIPTPFFDIPIRGYGFCLVIAIFASLALVVHLTKRHNISADTNYSLCFWTVISGIIGARVFYVTEYWRDMLIFDAVGNVMLGETVVNVLNIAQGGLVVFGAIIGGILGSLIFMYRNKLPMLTTLDAMSPAVMLGIAIGRIGCLLNGCCFGGECHLPWAITFPLGSPVHHYQVQHGIIPPDAACVLPVHPTQIYSSLTALLICGVLLALGKTPFYRNRTGLVFASFLILYAAARFLLEMIRTDEDSFFGTGLTVSQNVCIAAAIVGVILWLLQSRVRR